MIKTIEEARLFLEEKLAGLRLSVELEQLVMDRLRPSIDRMRERSYTVLSEDDSRRARQWTVSNSQVRSWTREIQALEFFL